MSRRGHWQNTLRHGQLVLHAAEFAVKLERIAQSPQWKKISLPNFGFMCVFGFYL